MQSMQDTDTQDTIEREIEIDVPLESVWELLTGAEHLGSWFADAGAEIDLRPGGELLLRWRRADEPGGRVERRGRVERVERPNAFAFRWSESAQFNASDSTLVEFTLSGDGSATTVRVVESGFASVGGREERLLSHTDGWRVELGHLAEHATRITA